MGKLRRSFVDARARASQRGRMHWAAAFRQLEAWILSRPVSASGSGPVLEISSLVSGDDLDDNNLLVSTPSPLVQQVLVVQTLNGVNTRRVRPLQHPVRPLRHPVRHPCSYKGKPNRTYCSHCCTIRS